MPPALANPLTQLVLAAALGAVGVYLLLPKPRVRWVSGGVALVIAAAAVFGVFLFERYGQPVLSVNGDKTNVVGSVLFWLFAAGAVGFGCVLVTQRNPARGAIAFAFVILSTCGLFLLLAAPFLMAATVIIYAGAIIVTFLFVLMLSHVKGPADENDRTREPLLGSLAGFGFVGLMLFTLHASSPPMALAKDAGPQYPLPAPPFTAADRQLLGQALEHCNEAIAATTWDDFRRHAIQANGVLDAFFAPADQPSVEERTKPTAADPRVAEFRTRTDALFDKKSDLRPLLNNPALQADARVAVQTLRDELYVYRGNGRLPARNVSNLGFLLYSEHLLAVEMAGTLLLVATVGAVAIARRKEVPA
ncbi:MAG: NADH-quinone oxidoreductase subunit J [Gemmataceae bacterium]